MGSVLRFIYALQDFATSLEVSEFAAIIAEIEAFGPEMVLFAEGVRMGSFLGCSLVDTIWVCGRRSRRSSVDGRSVQGRNGEGRGMEANSVVWAFHNNVAWL